MCASIFSSVSSRDTTIHVIPVQDRRTTFLRKPWDLDAGSSLRSQTSDQTFSDGRYDILPWLSLVTSPPGQLIVHIRIQI